MPIMVQPVNLFDRYSSPVAGTRIIEAASLLSLKTALRAYGTALAAHRTYRNEAEVAKLVAHYKLAGSALVAGYSKGFTVSKV